MCSRYHRHRVINTTIYMTWHWSLDKTRALIALAWFIIGGICGFFMGKAVYNQPIKESVVRDTVRITDTIPHYYPQPVDGTVVKYVTKFLPVVKTDTVTQYFGITEQLHDTVAVEVPIESKHYHADEYDAWVSGFEPSLDSIKVYREKEYITETITRMKPPNKLELDIVGGIDYGITSKQWQPFAGGELILNNHKRLKFGIGGGVKREPIKREWQPYVEGNIRLKVF